MKDGRRLQSGDIAARGGPDAWMSDDEVKEKFDIFTRKVLSKDRAEAIWNMRDRLLEPDAKLSELMTLIMDAPDGKTQ